jgi:Spy/CpxP family protein refolding chaperone
MKTLIMVLSLALVSSVALAQPAGVPPDGPQGDGKRPPIERIKNNLDLTDEQVKKMREIRDNGGSRADMQAVLTPEQRAKAAGLRKEHAGELEERKAHMQEQLGLSDEQKAKMAELRKQGGSREEMRAVLTPEQQAKAAEMRKEHKGERDERKAHVQEQLGLSDEQKTKMAEIRKQGGSREEMRAVLTPQQQAKFDAMRSRHQGPGQKPKPAADPEQDAAPQPAE